MKPTNFEGVDPRRELSKERAERFDPKGASFEHFDIRHVRKEWARQGKNPNEEPTAAWIAKTWPHFAAAVGLG